MAQQQEQAQVVVWGGGTGGVAAALQAARGGAETLLLTPGPWLGGMVSTAGVCCPDGNELSPWQTGLWGAFLRELARREPEGLDHNWVSCFGYRPATAEALLQEWVTQEPLLRWWPGVSLEGIERRGNRIGAVEIRRNSRGVRVTLELLIDGSDRGETYPLAAAPHRFGWEAQELWGEPSAPPQGDLDRDPFFVQQPVQSPTWVVMGQLTPDLRPEPPDGRPPSPPDPAPLAEPFQQGCEAFGLERTITYGRLPGGLVMLNWPLHGNDWHQGLERAFSGDADAEADLDKAMQAHSLRFAASLQEASGGRLRLGEGFPLAAGSPAPWLAAMPYWREGRRLVGLHTVVEQELLPIGAGESIAALPLDGAGTLQSVAVGNYANDHHYPGPDWPLAPKSCRWGGRWSGTPFCLPYGALVSAEVENLMAADKASSISHMANGATRLQPLILNTGQAAGAAAALCIRHRCRPAELPVQVLQEALIRDAHAPSGVAPLWDTPWHHPDWVRRQLTVLEDPSRLSSRGSLDADPTGRDPCQAPGEPGERIWQGELQPDGTGGFALALAGGAGIWPLITLEPALHQWLNLQERPRSVALIGCANPWGPWLRVNRLAR